MMKTATISKHKEFTQTRELLNTMDQSNYENQKFYELFDVLTTIGETDRELEQINESEKLVIENVANSGAQASISAEAILAELTKTRFIRFPEQVPSNSAMMLSSNNNDSTTPDKMVNFKVFPNPSEADVVVLFEEASTAEGSLLDAMGRVVRIIEIDGQTLRYEINGLAHGIYTLAIRYTDGKVDTQRIIIK